MKSSPSRLLNEPANFFGLSIWDLAGLGYLFVALNGLLGNFGLELLSFPILGIVGWFLIQVRLNHRPKVVRDFFRFKMRRQL